MRVCNTHRAYEKPDLERLPDDYLPRTNYRPMLDRGEYLQRTPRVGWGGGPVKCTDGLSLIFIDIAIEITSLLLRRERLLQ